MSSGCGGGVVAHLVEHGEHLPSDVALQTADDLLFGLALLETPRHVVLGRRVVAQPHHHDPVQRSVGLAVTAAVEAVAAKPTLRCTGSCWCGCATTRRPRTTWRGVSSRASPKRRSSAV